MRHIIPISGKDSLATALFQTAHRRDLEYEFLFNDTGAELPETYAWLDKVERDTGFKIQRVGKNLEEIISGFDVLPAHKMRYCTRMAKIQPMEAWIGDTEATVYYGLRADEDRGGYVARSHNITPAYPLRDFGIDLRGVLTILQVRDLMPPTFFWQALYDSVCNMIGDEDKWPVTLEGWQKGVLFSGRTRANCYFCFYQRQYEYVWLAETHPDIFRRACEIEDEHGGDDYTWREGYRLSDLPSRRDEILEARARSVVQTIVSLSQTNLFGDSGETLLASTSCGLLCGK
jgi:hypothetical protein